MNRRIVTILLVAFGVAAVCGFLVNRIVGTRIAQAHQSATTRVVAAAIDIKLGTVLSASDLTTIEIAGALPKDAILTPDKVIGRGVVSALYQGEPILEDRLAAPGSGGGLAATIRPGMRACAVKVDDVVGVAGFVTPGMRVDVLISGNPPGLTQSLDGPKVKTLLQNLEVLSAGTDIQKDAEGKAKPVQVVNLLVTPEDAEVLSLASSQTRIQLVLRNPLDTQISETTGTVMSNLFADKNGPVKPKLAALSTGPKKPVSHDVSIQIFNGSKLSEEKFASSEGKQ